jgi:hypothetical protein
MDRPPPSKPDPPAGLAEVERALSVLKGRHPEHERLQREDEERRKKRREEIEAEASTARRKQLARTSKIGGAAGAVLIVVAVIAVVARREMARRARLDEAADPYRGMGFALVDTSSRGEPGKLDASVPPGCILAASTAPSAKIKVSYAGGTMEGPSPVFGCICAGADVNVTSDVSSGEGLVLLRAEASTFGGSRAFAFLPLQMGTIVKSDAACADASLDAWLETKRWSAAPVAAGASAPRPAPPVDAATNDAWFAADPRRSVLTTAGFKLATIVKTNAPFAVAEVPAESCVLLAPSVPTASPSIRLKGGAIAVGPAAGNVGWCTSTEQSVIVQREGEPSKDGSAGDITVLIAPAGRVGGIAGESELADRAALPLRAMAVPAADHGWSAKQFLVASSISDALVKLANGPELGSDPEARIVALSLDKPNLLSSDSPDGVYSYCDPSLDNSNFSLCVFSGTHKWRIDGASDASCGLARTKHPAWMFTMQTVSEPAALKVEAQMLKLARTLKREGFEPTTIEAVTELDQGAEVLGRANEDAMVVVALSAVEPWAFPYTDGPAWTLGEAPRVIPIKPLERVKVNATSKTLPPKAARRSVVFRHVVH